MTRSPLIAADEFLSPRVQELGESRFSVLRLFPVNGGEVLVRDIVHESAKGVQRAKRIMPLPGQEPEGIIKIRRAALRNITTVGVRIRERASLRRRREHGRRLLLKPAGFLTHLVFPPVRMPLPAQPSGSVAVPPVPSRLPRPPQSVRICQRSFSPGRVPTHRPQERSPGLSPAGRHGR